jgi:2-succinyl-5-enolpyruvyl-6-hydroxy-3-cyclohexene-1-carboxylate synthase
MTSTTTAAATFAATLVDEWVRAGVTDAVVAPGSRSTPLALALAGHGRLRLHVLLDERSAAFFAVGLGRATGRPAVVVTTSGTAAAELHAGVLEAHHGRVPLLVATANRPPELHDVGAPQTVDQTHLFGRAARWFAAPGVPDAGAAATWRSLAARAVIEATGSPPGPVHLDLAFRDPLTGEAGELPPGRPGGRPWHQRLRPAPVADDTVVAVLAARLAGRRVAVIAGEGTAADESGGEAVLAAAARLGWPVLADPRSGCRLPSPVTVARFDALVRAPGWAAAHRPDAVVRLGAAPASRALATWVAGAVAAGAEELVVDGHGGWVDPDRSAATLVTAGPVALLSALVATVTPAPAGWVEAWATAETAAAAAIDGVLADHPEPTEPGTARALAGLLPDGGQLVVSSSLPVREVEWFAAPRRGLRVHANRGANGIDGVTSTALGVAAAGFGPTTLLTGDLAFLHDGGALVAAARARGEETVSPLLVVVLDNDGGGIFSFLPQAGVVAPDRFEQLFGTPHGLDLAAVAGGYGLPADVVEKAADLAPAVTAALAGGVTRVLVVPTARPATVAVHAELQAAVAAALSG